MAYRKTYRRNNRSYAKPRRQYKKKNDNLKRMLGHVANKALDHAKNVPGPVGVLARGIGLMKTFINVEQKYLDTVIPYTSVSNASTNYAQVLNATVEGNAYNERSGQTILNKNVTVNWAVRENVISTDGTFIKLALVMDKKPDVTLPATMFAVYGSGDFLAQVDKEENGDRFVILKTEIIALNNGVGVNQTGKFHIDLTQTHTEYDSDTADFEKNALWFMAISDKPSGFDPILAINARFRYYDN